MWVLCVLLVQYARLEVCIDDDKAKRTREEKEAKEENGTRRVPRSQAVLDYADAVLAVGERRDRYESRRSAVDGTVQARARGADGVVEQHGLESCPPKPHARGAVVAAHRDSGEVA